MVPIIAFDHLTKGASLAISILGGTTRLGIEVLVGVSSSYYGRPSTSCFSAVAFRAARPLLGSVPVVTSVEEAAQLATGRMITSASILRPRFSCENPYPTRTQGSADGNRQKSLLPGRGRQCSSRDTLFGQAWGLLPSGLGRHGVERCGLERLVRFLAGHRMVTRPVRAAVP